MQLNDYEIKHNTYLREHGAECTLFLKRDNDSFPLSAPCKLALYGNGARNTIKGGTGSGEVNSRFFVNIEDGLTEAGFTITTKDWLDGYDEVRQKAFAKFVKDIKASARKKHVLAIIEGMGKVMPEPAYALPLEGEGDTAVYVLSRISGEGADREPAPGDIMMTPTEIRDILAINAKYEKFMLVINAGGPVDISPVEDQVANILVLSQLGVVTGNIFADILLGVSNPSGKLTTTWTKWEEYPRIGDFGDKNDTYYNEGIYVGYRFFDTVGQIPKYPFGFGLSYTKFDMETLKVTIDGAKVTALVNVRNLGDFPGREVVQAYLSAPKGELDKPYQELCGFAKTPSIQAGHECNVSFSFDLADCASYDPVEARYVLEAGDYYLRIGGSSRDTYVAAVLSLTETVNILQVKNHFGNCGFDDYMPKTVEREEDLEYAFRLDIDPTAFTERTVDYQNEVDIPTDIRKMSDDQLISLNIGEFNKKGGALSVIGEASSHVAGAAGESSNILESKGYPVLVMSDGPAGLRLSRKFTRDADGRVHSVGEGFPESFSAFMPKPLIWLTKLSSGNEKKIKGEIKEQYATAIPIGTAIAQSFNVNFAWECGNIVGSEMEMFGVDLWLAPALNIHRSIRCGRNFEYFSEDPLLSGKFAAAITNGVQSHKGRGTTIKHYAANNQETNRYNNNSHVSERALREIYLKGFEICVKESQPLTVMTSYNLLNGVHTSESRALIEDTLRCEFGFTGVVMTDWVVNGGTFDKTSTHRAPIAYKVAAAGNDLFMPGSKREYENIQNALKERKIDKYLLQRNAARLVALAKRMKG